MAPPHVIAVAATHTVAAANGSRAKITTHLKRGDMDAECTTELDDILGPPITGYPVVFYVCRRCKSMRPEAEVTADYECRDVEACEARAAERGEVA